MTALETRVADLGARLGAVERDVGRLDGTRADIVRLTTEIKNVKEDVEDLGASIAALGQKLQDRQKQASEEQRSLRIALISLTAVIMASLIAAAATIIAAGIGP